jgi:hypothetical protein
MTNKFDSIVENLLRKPMKWSDIVGQFNPQQLKAAREWVSDCQWRDLDIGDLSDIEIVKGIGQNYDGGWRAFLRDDSAVESQEPYPSTMSTSM